MSRLGSASSRSKKTCICLLLVMLLIVALTLDSTKSVPNTSSLSSTRQGQSSTTSVFGDDSAAAAPDNNVADGGNAESDLKSISSPHGAPRITRATSKPQPTTVAIHHTSSNTQGEEQQSSQQQTPISRDQQEKKSDTAVKDDKENSAAREPPATIMARTHEKEQESTADVAVGELHNSATAASSRAASKGSSGAATGTRTVTLRPPVATTTSTHVVPKATDQHRRLGAHVDFSTNSTQNETVQPIANQESPQQHQQQQRQQPTANNMDDVLSLVNRTAQQEAITDCLRAANLTRWLFTGTSHTRNLFEIFTLALLSQSATNSTSGNAGGSNESTAAGSGGSHIQRKKRSGQQDVDLHQINSFYWPTQPLVDPSLQLAFLRNFRLHVDPAASIFTPPKGLKPAEMLIVGRFMWDSDVHNAWPHDFFSSTVERLTKLKSTYLNVNASIQQQSLRKILFHMPHAVKPIDPAGEEGFLTQQLQCRTPQRIHMYRRLARCAVHYVNTADDRDHHHRRSSSLGGDSGVGVEDNSSSAQNNTTTTAKFPKIELFDIFEFTKQLPQSMAWGGGHHYQPSALDAMMAHLLDRHVCPGRNIAGQNGFNNADALPFDKDPWANVDEDCKDIFEAAEKKDFQVEFGPIGEGVYEGLRFPPPPEASKPEPSPSDDRTPPPPPRRDSNMHLHRNFTAANTTTGEYYLNGFRIQPRGMKPLDKVFQNIFDRTSQACACADFRYSDGCQLERSLQGGGRAIDYYCRSKIDWKKGAIRDVLPTYMDFGAMKPGHWDELATLLSMDFKKKKRLVPRIQMCLFNLGARAEDVLDEEYLHRNGVRRTEWRFACQCSGVFAPHLKPPPSTDANATALYMRDQNRFCKEVYPSYQGQTRMQGRC